MYMACTPSPWGRLVWPDCLTVRLPYSIAQWRIHIQRNLSRIAWKVLPHADKPPMAWLWLWLWLWLRSFHCRSVKSAPSTAGTGSRCSGSRLTKCLSPGTWQGRLQQRTRLPPVVDQTMPDPTQERPPPNVSTWTMMPFVLDTDALDLTTKFLTG